MPKAKPTLDRRRAGLLLHPTSLPGGPGNGDFGPDAYHFVDFMAAAGFTVWQTLPMGPTHEDRSPYQCLSVHAGSPLLISLDLLRQWGWLEGEGTLVEDFALYRHARLVSAHRGFRERASDAEKAEYRRFILDHAYWLADYALFMAIKRETAGKPWWLWPEPLRDRVATSLEAARERLADTIEQVRFEQFLFFKQWREIKLYANQRGIQLFGDLPIFVAHDSADVWAHREYFKLDERGQPTVVAGVPPDYFSATGQRWGNPLYRWELMAEDGYAWWRERMHTQIQLFDLVRIDHFRGFEAYWEVPAHENTAMNGRWVKAPGDSLFKTLLKEFHPLPVVAEDLGLITEEVTALREKYRLPGMKILQFAFDGNPHNPYLPHKQEKNSVVYTGTHDNNTTVGWYEDLPADVQNRVHEYFGFPSDVMPWPLVRSAFGSVAKLAIVPMQDLLELDGSHRMNTPGTSAGNWRWRFTWKQVPEGLAQRLRGMIWLYGREV